MSQAFPQATERRSSASTRQATSASAPGARLGIAETVNRDLAEGSWGGIFAYVVAWVVIGLVTSTPDDHPRLFVGTLTAYLLLAVLRLRLIMRLRWGLVHDGQAWRRSFATFVIASGLLWSVATAVLGTHDPHSLGFRGATFGLLTMAGVGTATMAPAMGIATAYVTFAMLPAVVPLLLAPNRSANASGVGLGIVFAFVLLLVRRMSRSYHVQLVTTNKLAEQTEDLLRTQAELQAAEHAREMFFAAISHELRNPLNGIIGMAEELSSSGLTAEQQRAMSVIRTSGDQMLGVIGDILDLAKARQGGLTLEAFPSTWSSSAERWGTWFAAPPR